MKVGQQPPYEINPDPTLSKRLGDYSDLFKKGLICESQGYGIGAFAYYRRIVEAVIDQLLNDIEGLIADDDKAQYTAALQRTKASFVATEKIEVVKHLIPTILRPGGANPLGILHTALSEGIHALSDEECLDRAVAVREAMIFLVHQVAETKSSAQKFNAHIRKLLGDRQ
jgi:hypothetical protein